MRRGGGGGRPESTCRRGVRESWGRTSASQSQVTSPLNVSLGRWIVPTRGTVVLNLIAVLAIVFSGHLIRHLDKGSPLGFGGNVQFGHLNSGPELLPVLFDERQFWIHNRLPLRFVVQVGVSWWWRLARARKVMGLIGDLHNGGGNAGRIQAHKVGSHPHVFRVVGYGKV